MALLVSAGAEVNSRDKERMTPLHAACAATGSFAVVATLLELGADMMARNVAGNTPAHTAALNGHVEAMEELLAAGFDMDRTLNGRGQTVLHLAALATKARGPTSSFHLNPLTPAKKVLRFSWKIQRLYHYSFWPSIYFFVTEI